MLRPVPGAADLGADGRWWANPKAGSGRWTARSGRPHSGKVIAPAARDGRLLPVDSARLEGGAPPLNPPAYDRKRSSVLRTGATPAARSVFGKSGRSTASRTAEQLHERSRRASGATRLLATRFFMSVPRAQIRARDQEHRGKRRSNVAAAWATRDGRGGGRLSPRWEVCAELGATDPGRAWDGQLQHHVASPALERLR
jgi:hypothetical protein